MYKYVHYGYQQSGNIVLFSSEKSVCNEVKISVKPDEY